MSYLVLPDGMPNFSQAVISLWFRVPQSSIDATRAAFDPYTMSRLRGLLPLIVFGPALGKHEAHLAGALVGGGYTKHYMQYSWHCDYEEYMAEYIAHSATQWKDAGRGVAIDPSYIALDCTSDEAALLSVNIQMGSIAELSGSWEHVVAIQSPPDMYIRSYPINYPGCIIPPTNPDGSLRPIDHLTFNYTMGSGAQVVLGGRSEVFRLLPLRDQISFSEIGIDASSATTVTPDHWHHLLLSFDLGLPCVTEGIVGYSGPPPDTQGSRTTSACKMYIAFDDRNLVQKELSCYWPGGHTDPNAILTVNSYFQASERSGRETSIAEDHWGNEITSVYSGSVAPTCIYEPKPIPIGGYPFGLPATGAYVDRIRKVEMAELQIFSDVTLNTGSLANRRAFVDADGKPVKPAEAEKLLGKKPTVLLHGTSNWKTGKNTGSLGQDFQRQGVINQYAPDPSLSGPQGRRMAGPVQLTRAAANACL